jgi:hypothetical protein
MLTVLTLALAMTASHQTSPTVESPVHLRIDQDGGVAPGQLRAAIDEVRRIWSAAGLRVTFGQYEDPAPIGEAVISVRIVGEEWHLGETPILGRTLRVRNGQIPSMFISAPAIRRVLDRAQFRGKSLRELPSALVDKLEAQALGRVLAHELGHLLLRNTDHSERGLMRPSYAPDDLISPFVKPFSLGKDQRPALRAAVASLIGR